MCKNSLVLGCVAVTFCFYLFPLWFCFCCFVKEYDCSMVIFIKVLVNQLHSFTLYRAIYLIKILFSVPLRPERVSAICASTVPDDAIFKARPASIISISWAPPKNGGWDLFVVDFSPYNFKNFTAVPTPPISLPQNTYELNVSVAVIALA